MLREALSDRLHAALDRLIAAGKIPAADYGAPEVHDPKGPGNGDFASPFCLAAAKKAGTNPRALAEMMAAEVDREGLIAQIEVAGPGFLNLTLEPLAVAACVAQILSLGPEGLPRSVSPAARKVNVEFVSVNPNGPITIGSGRGAAFGSALCRVLEAAGYGVHREYYINDGVNSEQMRLFAESVRSFVLGTDFPEKGYRGDYVQEVAEKVSQMPAKPGPEAAIGAYQALSQQLMLDRQAADLAAFGVTFDTWFSEQSLHDSGEVLRCLDALEAHGVADTEPYRTKLKLAKGGKIEEVLRDAQDAGTEEDDDGGAAEASADTLWLRSTKFGDDMDRVLRRRDGRLTYIASDVAYHKDKFNRGSRAPADGQTERADKLITILGPDHHGYIGRLRAVVAAMLLSEGSLGPDAEPVENPSFDAGELYRDAEERDRCLAYLREASERLEVVIFQLVKFVKDGKPAPMRKRDGNIYALIDLIDEIGRNAAPNADQAEQRRIGRDVARFFYLMRSHDTALDFDLDLASRLSDENPVFYVQYAHARICSILRKAADEGYDLSAPADPSLLSHPRELELIRKIADLAHEVRRCAEDYGVHRLTSYAQDLAKAYHLFYDACRVLSPEAPELSRARLALCQAAQVGLQAVFGLLGLSAPERMERESAQA